MRLSQILGAIVTLALLNVESARADISVKGPPNSVEIVAEARTEELYVLVSVYLKNTSDKNVTITEMRGPAWQLYSPWQFQLEANNLDFNSRGVFSFGNHQKELQPKQQAWRAHGSHHSDQTLARHGRSAARTGKHSCCCARREEVTPVRPRLHRVS